MELKFERQNLAYPDKVISFDGGRLAEVQFSGVTVAQAIFDPGWRWSRDVGREAGRTHCSEPHVGYVVHGRLMVEMEDGRCMELGPGDVATLPEGHDAWTVGDEVCVLLEMSTHVPVEPPATTLAHQVR